MLRLLLGIVLLVPSNNAFQSEGLSRRGRSIYSKKLVSYFQQNSSPSNFIAIENTPRGLRSQINMSSKLYIRGLFTNGLGIGLLWLVDHFLGLGSYVKLSLGIQYVVYLLHALPQQSEKFYDITGR
jgi:hypothetical protein